MTLTVQSKKHAVFIAAPGMGHVLPLLQLAFWAATSGVMSTFIASDVPLEKLASSGQLANLEHPNLRLVGLKSGGVTWADFSQGPKAIMSLYQQMIVPTEATLRALVAGAEVKDGMSGKAVEAVPAPTAIVASPFIFFGPPIAKELGLRWTTLVDTSVIGAVVTLKLADEAASCSDDEAVCPGGVNMPGYMDVPASDLINVFGEAKLTKKSPTVWLASGFRDLVKASDSLLVNTTSGLDPELLKYFTPRATYPIGPIFQRTPVVLENGPVKAFLGAQQPRSLLYIALGSLGSLSHAQSEALISVLRTTKLPFLWVDRDPLVCDLGGDGGQGPRSKHPSVGLFYSHGGWNSTIEALSGGVPVLVQPSHAEQVLNSRVVVEKYQVGRKLDSSSELSASEAIQAFADGRWGSEIKAAEFVWEGIVAAAAPNGWSDLAWKDWVEKTFT